MPDDILRAVDGDENPLAASAHPVMEVYCDAEGIVCYRRHNAAPLRLNQLSPRRSRDVAKERLFGLLDMVDEKDVERDFTISRAGMGLTYNQLKMQTVVACQKSRQLGGEIAMAVEAKRQRYKI